MSIFITNRHLFGRFPYTKQNHLMVMPYFWSGNNHSERDYKVFQKVIFCWQSGALEIDISELGKTKPEKIQEEMRSMEDFVMNYVNEYRPEYTEYFCKNDKYLRYPEGNKKWDREANKRFIVIDENRTHKAYAYSPYLYSIWSGIMKCIVLDGTVGEGYMQHHERFMDNLAYCWSRKALGIDLYRMIELSDSQVFDAMAMREVTFVKYIDAHKADYAAFLRAKGTH